MEHDSVSAWHDRQEQRTVEALRDKAKAQVREAERRLAFWEQYHRVPTQEEVAWGKNKKVVDEGGVDK